ncbi:MAG: 16S rRNA (adenine(1518)-N(6)/adenine(1519)-N(6))-dimethyltransferase RsmA [Gammaproteobacteria bacterium]
MSKSYPRAKKRFGQNFLEDRGFIQDIVRACDLDFKTAVLEIGPGLGALSDQIIPKIGSYTALEIDRDLHVKLQKKWVSNSKINILLQDALEVDWPVLIQNILNSHDLEQKIQKIKIIGNLPYNIATVLIFNLLPHLIPVESCVFMLQKEVVDRMVAFPNSKDYGRLSIVLQYCCEVRQLFDVPPEAFYPAPKVMSSVVEIRPYPNLRHPDYPIVDPEKLGDLVKIAFSMRRKTIANNFKPYLNLSDFENLNLDPKLRAENLSILDFIKIVGYLEAK